ncbi:hypothetical protein SADUNF_Sadunf11G0110400 [Salix dunnii]|uniref:WAT1-related protein n=1 Tax=Salix dunnii TaxID=1413687 RepID=A0A835JR46_9ROSI|nr:hypothetical protein SADUNF_Sadunf11G0110400 [Salix dunnii]
MKTILSSETMDIPDGVKIKINARIIEVEGPRGKLTRNFKHLNLDFQLIKDEEGKRKLKIDAWFGSRKTSAAIRTALSHVENLITGVTKGYRYKMRFVYAHFPINASITNSNTAIEIRNFLGEKKVRKVDMLEGVSIVRSEKVKDELVLDGNDIELVSRSAALINQKCHVKNKDIRKFLDGIYVSEKGTVFEEEFTSWLVVFTSFICCHLERSLLSIMACIMKPYMALKGSAIRHQVLLAMTFIQFGFAGMTLISKAALNDGMNPLVFNAYRQVIATFVLALLVLLMERKKSGSLSFSLFCKIFVAALLGPTLSLDLYYVALHLTSATFAAAILNSIPVVTFVLAIIMGLETVGWKSFYGGLKILGIVITVGGSMLLSFYRKPSTGQPHSPSPGSSEGTFFVNKLEGRTRSILGPVLMFLSAIAWSTWLVVQSKLLELYPARLRLSTLQCLISSVQSTIIAVAFEREPNSWKIRWDIKLASLAYCGVFVTGAAYGLQIWCIERKGPFYVSMFSPLALVLTAIFSAIFWAERLNWQSILGAILVVGGLYGVLWGRNKAEKQEIHNITITNRLGARENDELLCIPLKRKIFMNMQACAPYAAMVLVQLSYGGSNILMKIAIEKGLN